MDVDIQRVAESILNSDLNRIRPDKALAPELAGKRLFDQPIIGYGDPNDRYFEECENLYDLRMKPPKEWLPSVKTIISVFFPYSDELKDSYRASKMNVSYEWLHVRVEGQALIETFLKEAKSALLKEGHDAMVPMQDERFLSSGFKDRSPGMPEYTSNWSERHVAYAVGLGTFSLTRAVITEKGAAGRFGSILTSMESEFTGCSCSGLYDNCTKCGVCIDKCPVSAITIEGGKDNAKCAEHLRHIMNEYHPYYGCGECQTGVPCESRIPKGRI